jgi:hypothetical protein
MHCCTMTMSVVSIWDIEDDVREPRVVTSLKGDEG